MIKVPIYNQQGEKVGEQELEPRVFGVQVKEPVIHQVVTAMLANRRQPLAHTKNRGDVSGGGSKPWRQKGTGRARHGSNRSPIWRGGGVTFGPRSTRNYSHRINKKMKRAALLMSLSDKVADNHLLIVDSLKVEDNKTKNMYAFLRGFFDVSIKNTNDTKAGKRTGKISKSLLIAEEGVRDVIRASRNIPRVDVSSVQSLNVLDLLEHEYVVVAKDAVKVIEESILKRGS